MDFMSDQLFDGRRIRVPTTDVRQSCRGDDAVGTMERVTRQFRMPKTIRLDKGPEFIGKDLDLWAYLNGVILDFCRPGKPTENVFSESSSGKFRTECLNAFWFLSLADARSKCEAWRIDCNEVGPHSSIGHKVPMELARASGQACLS